MFGELLYHTDVANEDHKKQEDLCPGGQWSRMHPLSTHTNVRNAGSRGGQSGPFQGAVVSPWDRTTASVPGILFQISVILRKKNKKSSSYLFCILIAEFRILFHSPADKALSVRGSPQVLTLLSGGPFPLREGTSCF